MQNIEQIIYDMMTENTGSHILDSGGAYGRHHERNAKLSIEDFKKQPAATLEVYKWTDKDGNESYDFMPCVNVFHHLTNGILEIDERCEHFNNLVSDKWDGEKFYGTNAAQEEYLDMIGLVSEEDDGFNTYNWSSNHSQVLQGNFLKDEINLDYYVLLQIHNGCDVRGGYTDARLFKVDTNYQEHWTVIDDRCGFSVSDPDDENEYLSLDWSGEWINKEGTCPDDDEYQKFALQAFKEGRVKDKSAFIDGDGYAY